MSTTPRSGPPPSDARVGSTNATTGSAAMRFEPPQLAPARTTVGMTAAAAGRKTRPSNTPPPQTTISSNPTASNGPAVGRPSSSSPSSPLANKNKSARVADVETATNSVNGDVSSSPPPVRFAPPVISSEKLAAMRAEVREIFQRGDEDTVDAIDAICESNGWTRDDFSQNRHTFQYLELFLAVFPTIPFIKYFPNVVHLKVMHCGLKEIDGDVLKSLVNLETLWLCENELSSIRNGGLGQCCPKLRELYVYNNNFTAIDPFLNLPNLEVLSASRNRISSLDGLDTLPKLRTLYIAGNSISRLRGRIEKNSELEELNLSGNKIASFREIPCLNTLSRLAKLFFADPTYGDNPVTLMSNYQTFTLCHIKSLVYLDFIIITPEQRAVAEATYAKKRMFYAMRLQTLERSLDFLKDEAFKLIHGPLKEAESSIVRLNLALGELEGELIKAETYANYELNVVAPDRARATEVISNAIARIKYAVNLRREEALRYRKAYSIVSRDMMLAQRKMTSRLLLELETGGNARLEDGRPKDAWYQSCCELLRNRFVASDFQRFGLGINSVSVSHVTRIHNTALRTEFDRELVKSVDIADPSYKKLIEYLFFALPVQGCSEVPHDMDTVSEIVEHGFRSLVEGELGYVPMTNSLYLAEQIRLMEISKAVKNAGAGESSPADDSSTTGHVSPTQPSKSGKASAEHIRNMAVGRVVVVKAFLFRQGVERGNIPMSYDVPLVRAKPLDRSTYGVDSLCVPRSRSDDPKQRIWYLFSDMFALPEYIIDFTYGVTSPSSSASSGGSPSGGLSSSLTAATNPLGLGIASAEHSAVLAAIPRPAAAQWPTSKNEELGEQLKVQFPFTSRSELVDMKLMAPHWLAFRDGLRAGGTLSSAAETAADDSKLSPDQPLSFSFPILQGNGAPLQPCTIRELTQKARSATANAFETLPAPRYPKADNTPPLISSGDEGGGYAAGFHLPSNILQMNANGVLNTSASASSSGSPAAYPENLLTTEGSAGGNAPLRGLHDRQQLGTSQSPNASNSNATVAGLADRAGVSNSGSGGSAALGGPHASLTAEHLAAQLGLWKAPHDQAAALIFSGHRLSGISFSPTAIMSSVPPHLSAYLSLVKIIDLRSNNLSMRVGEWNALTAVTFPKLERLLLGDNKIASLPSAAALAPMALYLSPTRGHRALQLSNTSQNNNSPNANNANDPSTAVSSSSVPIFPTVKFLDLSKNAFVDVTCLDPLRRMFPALEELDVTSNVGGLGGVGAALSSFAAQPATAATAGAGLGGGAGGVNFSNSGGIQCAEATECWQKYIVFVAAPPTLKRLNGYIVDGELFADGVAPPSVPAPASYSQLIAAAPSSTSMPPLSKLFPSEQWSALAEKPLQLTIPLAAEVMRNVSKICSEGLLRFALATHATVGNAASSPHRTSGGAAHNNHDAAHQQQQRTDAVILTESGALDVLSMKNVFDIALKAVIMGSSAAGSGSRQGAPLFPSFANTNRTATMVAYEEDITFDTKSSVAGSSEADTIRGRRGGTRGVDNKDDLYLVSQLRYLSLCNTLASVFPKKLVGAAAANLTHLQLEGHQFSEIDGPTIRSLVNAESISFRHNQIRSIPVDSFSHLPCLTRLDMGFNRLRDVGDLFSSGLKCASLQCAVFDNNFLKSVAPFSLVDSLQALYVSNNLIETEKDVNLLRDVERLIILDLSGNPCSNTNVTNSSAPSSFAANNSYRPYIIFHLRRLKVLDGIPIDTVEATNAREIFAGRVSAELLNERVAPATNWAAIIELNLSSCGLKEVLLLEEFTSLQHLRLEHNLLSAVDGLCKCSKLITLNLADNKLGDHPAGPAALNFIPSLESLSLEANGINSLEALGLDLPKLKFLNLKANNLVKLDGTQRLTGIREIILDANKLRTLDREALVSMAGLRELSCNNNALKLLEGTVAVLRYLTKASFETNRLGDIHDMLKAFEGSPLVSLSLLGNAVVRKPLYRNGMIHAMPCLKYFDGKEVTMEERERVELTYMSAPSQYFLSAGGGAGVGGGAVPSGENGGAAIIGSGGGPTIGGIPVSSQAMAMGAGGLVVGGNHIQPSTNHNHPNNQRGDYQPSGMGSGGVAPLQPPTSAPTSYLRGSGLASPQQQQLVFGVGGRAMPQQQLVRGGSADPRQRGGGDPTAAGSTSLSSNLIRVPAPTMGAGRYRKQ